MMNGNRKLGAVIIMALALVFGITETIYFYQVNGPHFMPNSETEIMADGIALILAALGIGRLL